MDTDIKHSDLKTEDWAAETLGVSKGTLANWRHYRRGPAFVKVGRTVFYTEATIDAYLATCVREPREAG